jgi:hypothetical protein
MCKFINSFSDAPPPPQERELSLDYKDDAETLPSPFSQDLSLLQVQISHGKYLHQWQQSMASSDIIKNRFLTFPQMHKL